MKFNPKKRYLLAIPIILILAVVIPFTIREAVVDVKYNYDNYTNRQYVYGNLRAPEVGEPAIYFEARDLDGNLVTLADYRGKPLVLTTGSLTCPMYTATISDMNALAKKMRGKVEFLVLYVREAHPGEKVTAHRTYDQKIERAKMTRQLENENRPIIVDELDGPIHQAYGAWPNTAFVIDEEGFVLLRHKWVDPQALEKALNLMLADKPIDGIAYKMKKPSAEVVERVFGRAGEGAARDFMFSAPGLPYHTFEEHYTN